MNKRYKVVLYQETYTTYEVEASSDVQAAEMVLLGKFPQLVEPDDVTVKDSEIIECEEIIK